MTLGPIFGIFETLQYTNLVFALAKYIGQKIDGDRDWYRQWSAWLAISLASISGYFILGGLWDIYNIELNKSAM